MVDFESLAEHLLDAGAEPFGLLTHQALPTADLLRDRFGTQLAAIFSPEHGYFGSAAAGEKTADERHPDWDIPIYSLYGDTRKPTPQMLEGLGRLVIDLQDIGVRCYTYLGTLKYALEAAAEAGIAVTVADRPIPLGGVVDGPMRSSLEFSSFVAPVNVPLCYGMTPGEMATWIVREENLDLDLTIIQVDAWNHLMRDPWPNFMPPSPGIKSWDSAVMYPATVFTEAFPALDCDRSGSLAFRILGAPWLNATTLAEQLRGPVSVCGIKLRPYRYTPASGKYAGQRVNGLLMSCDAPSAFYPVTGGMLVLAGIATLHPEETMEGFRADWFDKLFGGTDTRERFEQRAFSEMFASWIEGQEAYIKTRISIY